MRDWQLQDAKNRFSELVKRAREEGPQVVTVRGERAAVIISAAEYDRLTHPKTSFAKFLLTGPRWPDELVDAINDRPRDAGRDVEF
jgi:prevent-host-death family protein